MKYTVRKSSKPWGHLQGAEVVYRDSVPLGILAQADSGRWSAQTTRHGTNGYEIMEGFGYVGGWPTRAEAIKYIVNDPQAATSIIAHLLGKKADKSAGRTVARRKAKNTLKAVRALIKAHGGQKLGETDAFIYTRGRKGFRHDFQGGRVVYYVPGAIIIPDVTVNPYIDDDES